MKIAEILLSVLGLASCALPGEQSPLPTMREAAVIEAPSGDYSLDRTHASVTVRVSHFGLSNYTLRFNDLNATLNFDADNPIASSVYAEVAIASVDTDYPGERDFDAELKSADWLDALTHPVGLFRSTSIAMTGPGTGRMTGELTLRGVTRTALFDVTYNHSYARHPLGRPVSQIGFSARGSISRSDYGIVQFLPDAGSRAGVADEVELIIEAEFVRPNAGQP